ncbi:hypothetical protein B0E53_05858 [Micromonospora sp. MH33]|uniref:hypothetical protein n=1 Tax=Micromonospora sp. MH33 TaxID=1945509 RepID=UPI000D147DAC|nr:hypothetical protein [Micromonospora sp. MH33]PSK62228.1 hypothetical protein B0E53_05858 [Micromonospora sp. MH33]
MPTLDDAGPFAPEPFRRHWFRDLVSQAGMIALMNSVLVGLAAALAVLTVAPPWLAATVTALVLPAAIALHLRVIRHRIAGSAARVGAVLTSRALAVAGPEPVVDRV